jgi:hypothetical protein
MSWITITDDPNTLPPLDTPVFLLTDEDNAILGERSDTTDGWLWAHCYASPHCHKGKWYVMNAEFDDIEPIAWHPLPELPKAEATP